MKIKEFAAKYHMKPDTVRYYEKENLLTPKRLNNSYREYDETCEKQLQFIIVLKQMGFTIKEIHQVLMLRDQPISTTCNVSTVSLLDKKMSKLEEKIHFYQKALEVIERIKALINEGKYEQNKEVIEELMLGFFHNIQSEEFNE
ncbi:putative transcriptional regulator [Bacillus sp. TS-2]|nr:putative transcriptional regulator [Bacillus sp. TS-2]